MLSQTASLVKQVGGGSRKRKQQQKSRKQQQKSRKQQQKSRKQQQKSRKQQQKSRKQQRKQQKQRGGSHQPLGFGPAAPTSGDYTILSAQELKAAGLNPQWFDENQVNPGFGGAITVPGGKLN
jgi:ATPase subunit of ABC transporter with duplicated ATPase domains